MRQLIANPVDHRKIPDKGTDLTGEKIGRLSVIGKAHGKHKNLYLCECECGRRLEVTELGLLSQRKTHCGCLGLRPVSAKARKELGEKYNGKVSPAHGRKKISGFNYRWSNIR